MVFLVKQKLIAIRDGFHILDENGNNHYYVKGKLFTIGKKFNLLTADQSQNLLFIKQRLFRVFPRYDILKDGQCVAIVKKKFSLFVSRYKIKLSTGESLKIKGDIFSWDFSLITENGDTIANISKKLFRISDSYAVTVYNDNYETLCLSIAIILDAIHHKSK